MMEMKPRTYMCYSPRHFVYPEDASKGANFRVPAMDRREQMEFESSCFDEMVKGF